MTPTNDATAAERVRRLTATDAMFANFMADSSFDSAEEMQRFIKWFDEPGRIPSGWDVTRYARAQMALAYAELTAQLAEARAECEREKQEHLETQKLHDRSMRMIEDAIVATRDQLAELIAALAIKGAT